jgi:hypothetical protein
MKKIIVMGVVVVVLFGLSAGASWMLHQNGMMDAEHSEGHEGHEGGGEKGGKSGASGHGASPGGNDVATGLRPGYNPDADSAGVLLTSVNAEKEAIKAREKLLASRQKSLDLILLDIRTERLAIDELRKQIDEELRNASDKMDALDRKSGELDKQRKQTAAKAQEISDRWSTITDSEKDSYKHMAQTYENMEAEAAAECIQKLADSGKMEMAAKILTLMSERKSAKLFAAMPDKTLASQLMEQSLKLISAPALNGQKK